MNEEPKILSIAPSFNCKLKCEGCYLTTDVTKEMRDATKDDSYWEEAMHLGVKHGYDELAMTLNPFPGAAEHAAALARLAKNAGFQSVNVTWTEFSTPEGVMEELARHIDTLSTSLDSNRLDYDDTVVLAENFNHIHYNFNILWDKELMKPENHDDAVDMVNAILEAGDDVGAKFTVQHLIYKPLSLYGDVGEFMKNYQLLMERIPIGGDGDKHIGDVAFGNLMGVNDCPGHRMLDIDPMGFVRRCPENPIAYDATDLADLEGYIENGVPNCGDACNCM